MSTITFRESRPNLAFQAIWSGLTAIFFGGVWQYFFSHTVLAIQGRIALPQVAGLSVSALIIALLVWAALFDLRRAINPVRLILSTQELRTSSLGKVHTYAWSELGQPTRKVVKRGSRGYDIVEIPKIKMPDAKPLLVWTKWFPQSFDEVMHALVQAKDGKLVQQPGPSLTDIPSTIAKSISAALLLALMIIIWRIASQ